MGKAKEILIKPIDGKTARNLIRNVHYSGKVDPRSQLHMGVYFRGSLEGAMQFGPSIDKRKSKGLVSGTGWNEFLELNRLAFTDKLPKNSESRAISIACRQIKKHAPHVKWILSYADATQCGDGTIYRASGFLLTQIKKNNSMWRMPDGEVVCKIVFEPSFGGSTSGGIKGRYGKSGSETSSSFLKRIGAKPIPGFQLRYIKFLDPLYIARLSVPVIPYSAIYEAGAGMYKGEKITSAGSVTVARSTSSRKEGFDSTPALKTPEKSEGIKRDS